MVITAIPKRSELNKNRQILVGYISIRNKARIDNMNEKKSRPSQFAGSWEMDDKEAEEIKKELKEIWKQSEKSNR